MRNFLFQICTLLSVMCLSTASVAQTFTCVGMDPTGKKINLIYDEDTSTINVNGTLLKIQAATNAHNGVATEDYEIENGKKAYVSLVVEDKDKIVVRQMDSKNDDELSKVELACK